MRTALVVSLTLLASLPSLAVAQVCSGCAGTPVNLNDTGGFLWDLSNGGSVCNGTSDAFDGHWTVFVDGQEYTALQAGSELNGRQLVFAAQPLGALEVERRVYVPDVGSAFARYYDTFTNTTASVVSATVDYTSNLGSDGSTTIWGSSDGDAVPTSADTWWGTDDVDGAGDPSLAFNVWDGAAQAPAAVHTAPCGVGSTSAQFQIVVAPGETVALVTFTTQASDQASAQAGATNLATTPTEAHEGLTARQKFQTLNWDLPIEVLVIYDTASEGTPALVAALTNAGYDVTLSDSEEISYFGINPAPTGFDTVVHLNGHVTYQTDMPSQGQAALVSYVQNGGGFVHFEWNAYELDTQNRMQGMTDLTLLVRTQGQSGNRTIAQVAGQSGHAVLAGLPVTWSQNMVGNEGVARVFTSDPVTVLATEGTNDAIAVREWQQGRIVGFHHAGNYNHSTYGAFNNPENQQLVINAVAWSSGAVDNANVAPTADAGGPYTVAQNVALALDGSGSTDPENAILTWEWDCEDDGVFDVTLTAPTGATCTWDAGTYTVRLRVTDAGGLQDEATAVVTVTNAAPTANAGGPYTGTKNNAIGVDGSASTDADGSIVQWSWDCDGDSVYEVVAAAGTGSACTFAAVGSYTIGLEVLDDDGGTGTATADVTVGNDPPTAAPGGPYAGDEGVVVALDGSGSSDAGGALTTWEWDCTDDGTFDVTASSGTGVGCTYDDDGAYTLRLRVTDDDGATDEATVGVTVANVAPTLGAVVYPSGDEGATLTFSAAATDVAADPLTYAWDFGDGGTAIGPSATHTYADDGTFTVGLTVTDGDGGSAVTTGSAVVGNVAPTITSTAPTAADQGALYAYSAAATDPGTGDTHVWTLDVGAPAGMTVDANGLVEWTPTLAQGQAGTASVTLTITDDDGGTDAESWTITVTITDGDADGLPDTWETANGLDPSDPSDATADGDADGLDNLAEYAGGTDPTVFDGPGAPTPVSPVAGAEVPSATPDLTFDNAVDPQADTLTYDIEVYSDAALTALVTSATGVVEDGSGTTAWTVDTPLTENAEAWWRARAADPYVAGAWSAAESFLVNAVDEAPDAPTLVFPVGGEVTTLAPTLEWTAATDIDGDAVTYDVEVWDSTMTTLITSDTGLTDGGAADVSWAVDVTLDEDATYAWTVRTVDADGLDSGWVTAETFLASATNGPPAGVVFTNPLEGDALFTTSVVFAAAEAVDPEGTAMDYQFEFDAVATFDGAGYATATLPGTGTGTVEWAIADDGLSLPENATAFARVRAIDADGLSSASDTISFFVRGENDPPEVPTLISPEDQAVTEGYLIFEVSEPVDPEGDVVTVDFRVWQGEDSTITEGIGVPLDGSGRVTWESDVELDGDLFWSARAVDADGAASAWAEAFTIVSPEPPGDDDDDGGGGSTGCDCASSVAGPGGRVGWLLLLVPLVLRRRR